jgi:DNA-binding response OmpR family regulator
MVMEMMQSGKIILVIDDDEDFQTILKVTLNQNGFQVRSLLDGELARMLEDKPFPDIILLDIDLPYTNGVEVSKRLKSNASTKNIPVIMVSANPFVDELCKEAGANDYVQKPFTLKTLMEKVNESLHAS